MPRVELVEAAHDIHVGGVEGVGGTEPGRELDGARRRGR